MSTEKIIRAYKDEFYPPVPTRATQRRRTNFLLQAFHFLRLNFKIMRIVVKGHS
ncbi:MAG TPA: hypothetical protein P5550_07245 [Bacteroidales bacterium]|nr:hypothetical protein [Bacteroidales bacterium]HRZ78090.1 hypothetical protein [Bacteroidales bacterium]